MLLNQLAIIEKSKQQLQQNINILQKKIKKQQTINIEHNNIIVNNIHDLFKKQLPKTSPFRRAILFYVTRRLTSKKTGKIFDFSEQTIRSANRKKGKILSKIKYKPNVKRKKQLYQPMNF